MKDNKIEKTKTRCIVCWGVVAVSFDPPIRKINGLEVECCKFKPKKKPRETKRSKAK